MRYDFGFVVAAQLRRVVAQLILQLAVKLKIRAQRFEQPRFGKRAVFIDPLLHDRHLVDGAGEAGAVEAEVVVLRAEGNIALLLHAVRHQHGMKGRGLEEQIVNAVEFRF